MVIDAELFLSLVTSLSLISRSLVLRSQLFLRLLWVTSLCQKLFHALVSGLPFIQLYMGTTLHLFILYVHVVMHAFPDVCAMIEYRSQDNL